MDGDQVPVIPFEEVEGSVGMELPAQYGPAELNRGKINGVIVMVRVVLEAHWPAEGVNV